MSLFLIIIGIIGSIIALLPGFLILIFIARKTETMWQGAFLGAWFWFVAYLLRIPLLLVIEFIVPFVPLEILLILAIFTILASSILAGVFEEGIRYLFLRWQPKFVATLKHAFAFGLGWGLGEAILIYALDVLAIGFFYPVLIDMGIPLPPEQILSFNIMLGGLERNLAILFHVTATVFVALAVWHRKPIYVGLAVLAHFLFNFIPISLFRLVLPYFMDYTTAVIVLYGLFTAFAMLYVLLADYLLQREGKPTLEPESPSEPLST